MFSDSAETLYNKFRCLYLTKSFIVFSRCKLTSCFFFLQSAHSFIKTNYLTSKMTYSNKKNYMYNHFFVFIIIGGVSFHLTHTSAMFFAIQFTFCLYNLDG